MAGERLYDFLMYKTYAQELCVIRDGGWIRVTCWIDHEDIWQIPKEYADREVKSDNYGELSVIKVTKDEKTGAVIKQEQKVPCHYIWV